MEFYDVVKARRSIRGYKSDPVPEDALKRIAEAVSLAPSACNIQPWSFRIVLNPELRRKMCEVYTAPWLAEAPAIAVVLGNADVCWKRLEGEPIIPVDIGIVMEHRYYYRYLQMNHLQLRQQLSLQRSSWAALMQVLLEKGEQEQAHLPSLHGRVLLVLLESLQRFSWLHVLKFFRLLLQNLLHLLKMCLF